MQLLIDKLCPLLEDLSLTLNDKKSVYMICKPRHGKEISLVFRLNNNAIKIDESYKYLGIELNSNLNNKKDIIRAEKSFLKQIYSEFRKFSSSNKDIMSFLFQSHNLSLYGCELWDDLKGSNLKIKSLTVNYHKCVKKIVQQKWSYSNHDSCEEAGLPILKHLLNLRLVSFAFSLVNTESPCILPNEPYLINASLFVKRILNLFMTEYNVSYLFDNDFDAIKSGIIYVCIRESKPS